MPVREELPSLIGKLNELRNVQAIAYGRINRLKVQEIRDF